jgi:hypothetical protein
MKRKILATRAGRWRLGKYENSDNGGEADCRNDNEFRFRGFHNLSRFDGEWPNWQAQKADCPTTSAALKPPETKAAYQTYWPLCSTGVLIFMAQRTGAWGDGSITRSALEANPFLTISVLAE